MASKSNETLEETKTVSEPLIQEPLYSVSDLAKAAKLFNTTSDVVITAMKLADKKEATEAEASKIINKFINKEVK